jgi:hypothetical protein
MEGKNAEPYDPRVMRIVLIIVLIPIICIALWVLAYLHASVFHVVEVQAQLISNVVLGDLRLSGRRLA